MPDHRDRRGAPGDWGGRPRVAWLVVLVLAAAGAVVVAAFAHDRTPAPVAARTRPALPKIAVVPGLRPVPVKPTPAKPNDDAVVEHLANRGSKVYCGAADSNQVALTFDDGPGPNTVAILRILANAKLPATFFLIGRNAQDHAPIARLEVALGMAIGDHTMTHLDLSRLPAAQVRQQIADARTAISAATGQVVTLFRPPYGARDRSVDAQARSQGLLEVLWDVDTRDSERATVPTIIHNARRGLRGGSIVLMHEDPTTVKALPAIVRSLRARHLEAVTVPQLVAGGHRTRTCPYIPASE